MNIDGHAVAEALGAPIAAVSPLAGGDISGASRISLADGRAVVAKAGPLVDREADMLRAIAATGAPCPAILAEGDGWFAMEWIEPDAAQDRWAMLADTLDLLHRPAHEPYGWDQDYGFGPLPIANRRESDWARFWAEKRLLCHLPDIEPGLGRRIERLAARLSDLLPQSPPAALLHGDLWGGNIVWSGGKAYLIDPACYRGDREVDLAMLTLFDSPPRHFFERLGLEPGWQERQPLYRLWPWLVHLRLFGSSYRGAVEREIAALGF